MARQFVAGKRFFLEEFGVETAGGLAARLVRLLRRAAADRRGGGVAAGSSRRRCRGTRPTGCRTTRSAGRASTARGCSRTSRRSTPTTPTCPRAELRTPSANFAEKGVAGVLDRARSAGATAAADRPARWSRRRAGSRRSRVRRASSWAARTRSSRGPRPSSREPPVWSGEMYLEFHRGTYTSQARTKQGNRRSEHLLREAELWAATAAVQRGADYPYDAARAALADRAAAPVPRHPARQLDRLGAPAGRGDLRRDRRGARGR